MGVHDYGLVVVLGKAVAAEQDLEEEPEEGQGEVPGEGLVGVPGCGWVEVLEEHGWEVTPGLCGQKLPGCE